MALISDGFKIDRASKSIRYIGDATSGATVSVVDFHRWLMEEFSERCEPYMIDVADMEPPIRADEPIGMKAEATCHVTVKQDAIRAQIQATPEGTRVTLDLLCGVAYLDSNLEPIMLG